MCHVHYEEQNPERSFFIVEAFRGSVWSTCCLLATALMHTNKMWWYDVDSNK